MKLYVRHIVSNWTIQNGPGTCESYVAVSKDGFWGQGESPIDLSPNTTVTDCNTFEHFMMMLELCRASVDRIKAGPQDTYGRVREMVIVEGRTEKNTYRFLSYGAYTPRMSFDNIDNPRRSVLAAMINSYIMRRPDAPDASVIHDYIIEVVAPVDTY